MNRRTLGLAAAAVVALAGCGKSIGDSCQANADCQSGYCDLDPVFVDGYCTQACVIDDSSTCPTRATCQVHHGITECLLDCVDNTECRSGYTCHPFRGAGSFCLTPTDI